MDSSGHKAGKGLLVKEELAPCLGTVKDAVLCYDGMNQAAQGEVCMTIRHGCGGGEASDCTPKVAYGISEGMGNKGNTAIQDEHAPSLSVCHKAGVIECIPIDMRNATRTTSPSETNRQGLGIGSNGGPCGTLSTLFTPAVAVGDSSNCLNPADSQSERIYGADGAHPSLNANNNGGQNRSGVLCLNTDDPQSKQVCLDSGASPTLCSGEKRWGGLQPNTLTRSIVRRLTPVECERLMGFPDNYTRIPYRGKPAEECPDSPRYKACGNSWAVNCARWIVLRINEKDKELNGGQDD